MSGVRGDFGELQKLVRNMRRLAGVDVRTAQLAAAPLGAEAQRTFDAGQNPYGQGWPATKTQGARRLNDSGALRAGATTFTPSGKRLSASLVDYARYQNPKLFIPAAGTPPASWDPIVERATERAVKSIMGAT